MQTIKTTNPFTLFTINNAREHIISASAKTHLDDLSKAQVLTWLANYGVIVLRGFTHDKPISELVNKVSRHLSADPGRPIGHPHFQPVNGGNHAIGLHTENGSCPATPDLLWFNCIEAPQSGSQTTICDGERVYAALPAAMKTLLTTKALKFKRVVPYDIWQRYAKVELGLSHSSAAVSIAQFRQIKGKIATHHSQLNDDGSITLEVITPAVHTSNFSSNLAFANSLFGPSDMHQKPQVRFADDSPITEEIRLALQAICQKYTAKIHWQHGDLCIIDNSRYMHGREAVSCQRRNISVAMSYL